MRIITALLKPRKTRDQYWQNIRHKRRIYSSRSETQMRENTNGYVIRQRHGRDFARDGRERPTEKYETIDTRGKNVQPCGTVQREEMRHRARDTISMLFVRRRRVRARTPRPSEHMLTHFPEIILSRKKFFTLKKI